MEHVDVLQTQWGPVRLDRCHPIIREEIELLGDADPFISHLGCVRRIRGQLESIPEEALDWRPAEGEWSIIEVLAHLVHTEVAYGYRYRMMVGNPGGPIEGYDQDDWVRRLPDRDRDVDNLLGELDELKRINVAFLQRLSPEGRESWGMHSERGPESVQALIGAMAGHDLIHEKQIADNFVAYKLREIVLAD